LLSRRTIDARRFRIALGVTAGAIAATALAESPLAYADVYDLEPVGPATVLNDDGIAGLFAYGQVTQEFAEMDATTGELATGAQAGSLDVTENIFASPYFGIYGFIDGADATNGTRVYAADAGNASDWASEIGSSGYGNIPLSQFDFATLFQDLSGTATAAAVPTDDFGLSGLGADLTQGLDSLLALF
jgi:hypothetical protein